MPDQYLAADDYADFRVGHETSLTGERAWWRNIIEADRERIHADLQKHSDSYRRLGYDVELGITHGGANADLSVSHRHPDRVTTADLEILKGSIAATLIKAGWGGGR